MQTKVVELTLDSGVRVYVTPLSRYQRKALSDAAETRYPYPDKTPFEIELSEDVAIPGMKIPVDDHANPHYETYQAEVARIDAQRSEFQTEAMLDMCVSFPDFPAGKDGLIDCFAADIARQRKYMTLPEDDWQATWRHAILRSDADEARIWQVVRDTLPVTEKEVNDNVRVFQPALSWEKSRLLAFTRALASGVQNKI